MTNTLPTDCPNCGKRLESREDVLICMITHIGDDRQ